VKQAPRKEKELHRTLGVEEFNLVWSLLGKQRRTRDEDDTMVHAAHASRFHWGIAGGPKEWAIGEWQISHVYAVLGREESASYHANRCLELCNANRLGDFLLAYAYEALARADALAGRRRDLRRHLASAYEAGLKIGEAYDRKRFFSDLKTVARVKPR